MQRFFQRIEWQDETRIIVFDKREMEPTLHITEEEIAHIDQIMQQLNEIEQSVVIQNLHYTHFIHEALEQLEQEYQPWITIHHRIGSRQNPIDIAAQEDEEWEEVKEKVLFNQFMTNTSKQCVLPIHRVFQSEDLKRTILQFM